ncbi:MAG: thiamine pyrophosphate-dependent enzyme [Candidatus Omnitrophica bacterium]|nr:thiamine pyrophosphate-dependent enzyme [Candidatus Omnitrophota bacterium]
MIQKNLGTYARNTWCPGCGNFAILNSITNVLLSLQEEGLALEEVALVAGIGCHGKIVDYINVNSFYSLHGRTVPPAIGIKLAGERMKVIIFSGDGDAYGEGLEHLIFAAKRNIDITVIVHDNRVYGLTTGQYTPTSPLGFRGRSTPSGTKELPLNPLELLLVSGATFLARGYSNRMPMLKEIIKAAIAHRGFSLVDVLQVCVTYFDRYEYYNGRVYDLKDNNRQDFDEALKKIKEWDYNNDVPIALGVFYQKEMPSFEKQFISPALLNGSCEEKIKQFLDERR